MNIKNNRDRKRMKEIDARMEVINSQVVKYDLTL